jgi:two-component system, NarL family, response regulator DevR
MSKTIVLEAQTDAPSARPVRVLLVDDNAVIRAGLRVLIDSWSPFQVVGEADTAEEALATVDAAQPNVIVCSHTGRSNGVSDTIRNLTKGAAHIPVVLLTGSRNPQAGSLAIQAGAKWIVSTKDAAIELRNALEKVLSGEKWLDESALTTRPEKKRNNGRSHGDSDTDQWLTNRERDVAALVTQGCTNRQVGKRLGITEVTVRHHLTSIFSKLRITNRFQLIAWSYRHGVTRPVEVR